MTPSTRSFKFDEFDFFVEMDRFTEPVSGTEVWVWFRNEPCCNESGHQYRIYLPAGVQTSTIKDICRAFVASVHCTSMSVAA